MKKLIIFDLDGTLLNTIYDLGEACNYALDLMGFQTHPITAYNLMVGNGIRKLMERAQPDADQNTIDELLSHFKEYYNDHCTEHTKPYPGITELLNHLKENEIKIAVASNKYQAATTKIINYFFPDIPFVAVEGQREGIPCKPDPSIIFSILLQSPTPKNDVLMVGDSAVDIETARRACVESVGVTWGFRPVSEIRRAYPGTIIYKPEELYKFIE